MTDQIDRLRMPYGEDGRLVTRYDDVRTVLESLVRRVPTLRVPAPGDVAWRTTALVRGPRELPATW